MDTPAPHLYTDLASWWPLISPPEDYAEEAEEFIRILTEGNPLPVKRVLELGSGGGHNAYHMKRCFRMTLADLSPAMVECSRRLNPLCEHIVADMRTLRLDRPFDAVFLHDAVGHMVEGRDLRDVLITAALHLKPGGRVLIAPDSVQESFQEETNLGGTDRGERGVRFLEWRFDPDPKDHRITVALSYSFREGERVTFSQDTFPLGLFPSSEWLELLEETGFASQIVLSTLPSTGEERILFLGTLRE